MFQSFEITEHGVPNVMATYSKYLYLKEIGLDEISRNAEESCVHNTETYIDILQQKRDGVHVHDQSFRLPNRPIKSI